MLVLIQPSVLPLTDVTVLTETAMVRVKEVRDLVLENLCLNPFFAIGQTPLLLGTSIYSFAKCLTFKIMKTEWHHLKCPVNYRSYNSLTLCCMEAGFLKYINWSKNPTDYLYFLPHYFYCQIAQYLEHISTNRCLLKWN